MLRYKQLYLACFLCHFLFIVASGCRATFSFVARGYTWLPVPLSRPAEKAETLLSTGLGNDLDASHPVRQTISIYMRLAGVESGYAFFAPNVPDNHKLVFEIHHADGRIEYDLPHVSSGSAGLRLVVLLDNLGKTRSDELREVVIKMVAYTVWRRYPDATMIRAVFGFALLPTAAEFRRGVRERDEFLYAYDFVFPPAPGPADTP